MISLRSGLTVVLLNYFFINPDEGLYVNELQRELNLDKRNLVKKIKELEKIGLLKSWTRGNLKFYSINKLYPLYNEYKNIILKTLGFESKLKKVLLKVPGIKKAYLYGSYARNKMDVNSDIDLLVVGRQDIVLMQAELNKLQKEIGREINAMSLDEREFRNSLKNKKSFVFGVLKDNKIEVI
ncbi:MAG: nucleotidyltransferase domain-containing protein [Candidatus Omnitrophica bacterium]|nr:nucleotidyltransferase domain-containing protein [Candidatus Omnitrophota bacterium]